MATAKDQDSLAKIAVWSGYALVAASLVLLLAILSPALFEELKYFFEPKGDAAVVLSESLAINPPRKDEKKRYMVPVDKEFGIVIPKIGANAKIIENVDPYNASEYQQKLTKGVAHAKGTSYPGKNGNMFLFAHSSDTFYNANRYNSVFYLLNKLKNEDKVFIAYKNELYEYSVKNSEIVDAERIDYLESTDDEETLTLMTCWPPGTTIKRLVVQAELVR